MSTTIREDIRQGVDQAKEAARAAVAAKAAQGRAAVAAKARHWWAETAKHRPSAFTAAAAIGFGLVFASGQHRLAAATLGACLAGVGAAAIYLIAYAVQYTRARRGADVDVENYAGRRPGAKARHAARQLAAATSLYGIWLMLVAALGVGAASRPAAVGLEIELLTAALFTWLACRGHWTHLWQERRRLTVELPAQRAGLAEAGDGDPSVHPSIQPAVTAVPAAPAAVVPRDERLPAPPTTPTPVRSPSPLGLGEWTAAIQGVLDQRGINAKVTGHVRGPVVTRYDVAVAGNVPVRRVEALARDFSVTLGGRPVRVICPVPGRPVVGVEVPNSQRDTVLLAEALRSAAMTGSAKPLLVCVGKSVDGDFVTADLTEMPHVLIGAATGGGKSVLIKSMLTTTLTRATPDQVRMLLIDPKRVELGLFAGVPHLVRPIVRDADEAISAIEWLVGHMEWRYKLLEQAGVADIGEYNALPDVTPFPHLLTVIDELADLMMVAAARPRVEGEMSLEDLLIRLLQLARAAGIHLVLATQDPRVDVITGRIKANLPSRIALATSSGTDSRVILDQVGAELLAGKGDALVRLMGTSTAIRVQVPLATREEIRETVEHWVAQAGDWPVYQGATTQPAAARPAPAGTPPPAVPDMVLAIVAATPGCSNAQIAAHPAWAARGGAPSQPQLSRATAQLTEIGLLTRVKDGKTWTDYQATDAGRPRAAKAAARLGLTVLDNAA